MPIPSGLHRTQTTLVYSEPVLWSYKRGMADVTRKERHWSSVPLAHWKRAVRLMAEQLPSPGLLRAAERYAGAAPPSNSLLRSAEWYAALSAWAVPQVVLEQRPGTAAHDLAESLAVAEREEQQLLQLRRGSPGQPCTTSSNSRPGDGADEARHVLMARGTGKVAARNPTFVAHTVGRSPRGTFSASLTERFPTPRPSDTTPAPGGISPVAGSALVRARPRSGVPFQLSITTEPPMTGSRRRGSARNVRPAPVPPTPPPAARRCSFGARFVSGQELSDLEHASYPGPTSYAASRLAPTKGALHFGAPPPPAPAPDSSRGPGYYNLQPSQGGPHTRRSPRAARIGPGFVSAPKRTRATTARPSSART